jgi:hypothetical protein
MRKNAPPTKHPAHKALAQGFAKKHGLEHDFKFQVLREIVDTDWADGRHHAMIESIARDVVKKGL